MDMTDALPIEIITIIVAQSFNDDVPVMVFPCTLVCRLWHNIVHHIMRSTVCENPFNDCALDNPAVWRKYAPHMAVHHGYIPLLRWLTVDMGIPIVDGCNDPLCDSIWCPTECAAERGDMAMLKFLLDNCTTCTANICAGLARHGDIELLARARVEGYPWNDEVYTYAIIMDRLDIVKYAYANGCPFNGHPNWQKYLMHIAAESGTPDTVRWLHEHGVRWNELLYYRAIDGDNIIVANYAIEHGCPIDIKSVLDVVVGHDSVKWINWILQHELATPDEISAAKSERIQNAD